MWFVWGENENAYTVWWGKPEKGRQLARPRCRCQSNLKDILRGRVERLELDSSGSRKGEVAGLF
jgi:hypothetical protein